MRSLGRGKGTKVGKISSPWKIQKNWADFDQSF